MDFIKYLQFGGCFGVLRTERTSRLLRAFCFISLFVFTVRIVYVHVCFSFFPWHLNVLWIFSRFLYKRQLWLREKSFRSRHFQFTSFCACAQHGGGFSLFYEQGTLFIVARLLFIAFVCNKQAEQRHIMLVSLLVYYYCFIYYLMRVLFVFADAK